MHDSRPDPNSPVPQAVTATTYDAANQQLAFGNLTQTFDANGNLLTQTDASGTTTYTWDARNRLVGISGPSLSATFAYDALGRRVSRTLNGTTTMFLYDALDIVGETSGGENATYLCSLAIDEALTRTDSSGIATYLADILGSTVALADGSGSPVTTYTYEPYGRTESTGTPTPNAFRFTGREDDGIGLYYYRTRYYDPTRSRFVREDPIGLGGGINSYAYAGSNPVRYRDPLGLDSQEYVDSTVAVGPYDAYRSGFTDANTAMNAASQSNPRLPGPHNGPQDAFRHCVWSCLMTQRLGPGGAKAIGDIHEAANRRGGQPDSEERMDQANNTVGRQCGQQQDNRSCPQRCMDQYMLCNLHGPGETLLYTLP